MQEMTDSLHFNGSKEGLRISDEKKKFDQATWGCSECCFKWETTRMR